MPTGGTGGTGGSPPVLVISGDTTISAAPSDPTSLVLATPFSYTFTSSGYSPAPVYNQGNLTYPCSSNSTGFSTNINPPSIFVPDGSYGYVYGSNTFSIGDMQSQSLSIAYALPVLPAPPAGLKYIVQMYVDGLSYGYQGNTNGHSTNGGCGFLYYSNGSNYFRFGVGATPTSSNYPYTSAATLTFSITGSGSGTKIRMTFFDGTSSYNGTDWTPTTSANANVWFDSTVSGGGGPQGPSGIWPSISVGVTIPRWPRTYPYVYVAETYWLPYLSGQGSTAVTISSGYGIQAIPSPNPTPITVNAYYAGNIVASYSNNLTVLQIPITTDITTPLSLITYQPFSYSFSIPSNVQYVTLKSNRSSSVLTQYVSSNSTVFSSTYGASPAGSYTLVIDAVMNGNYIAASNVTNVNIADNAIIVTPAIPTGSLNLYKYETFSYVFTVNPLSPELTLQVTNSSSDLRGFCTVSGDSQTVTFAGTPQTSYSSVLSLVVDLMYGTTIVSTTTILISISPGRFFPPALNQNYQMYQYENVSNTFGSNPIFATGLPVDTVVSFPSLPAGLSFGGSCNLYYLQGTPQLQSSQSNYQIIGSNSSNGKLVTTIVSMKVNPSLVRLTPNTVTVSSMTVGTALTPVTIVGSQPSTIYAHTFLYTWESILDGIVFKDINGNTVSQGFTPSDSNLTIVLAGTPTLAAAQLVANSGGNLYQTRLYGVQTDQTGKRTIGSGLISLSFAETVLISATNSVTLYQYNPLGTSDVIITANSYFSTAVMSSITATSLPPGLSLVSVNSTTYRLTGTPTTVDLSSSYTFTATNTNGLSRSVTIAIPVNPDIITFGGTSPPDGTAYSFIVSRPLTSSKTGYYTTPGAFSATSTSGSTPITYSSSISLATYGLTLNANTGILSGIPTTPLSQTTVTITATDALGTTGTTTIFLTILADSFTWPTYTPSYFQNRAITSYQFAMVATLSDRTIQSYSSTDLPTGLTISPSGVLSGTPTTYLASGTFTIIATTGYSTITQPYTYSMTSDNVLTLQLNSVDPITTIFSNIFFTSIQYSTNAVVNPTYTITTYPIQPVPPVFSLSPAGNFSGNFTGVKPYSTYLLDVNASNGTLSSTTYSQLCVTVKNPAITDLIIGNIFGKSKNIKHTSDYVFQATTTGQKIAVGQTWPVQPEVACDSVDYPDVRIDISTLGSNIYATLDSNVYNGVFSNGNITWSLDTTIAGAGIVCYAIVNDGSNWVVMADDGGKFVHYAKTTTGSWSSYRGAGVPAGGFTYANESVLQYEPTSSNFVLGSGTTIIRMNSSSLYSDATWYSTTFSGFTVSRIAISNSTLVAIGSNVSSGAPMSISTNGGSNWTQVSISTPSSFTKGANSSPVFTDILYANGSWVMCGQNNIGTNFIAYGTSLSNWTIYSNPAYTCTAIAFNGNAWSFGSSNGLLSVDAGPWPTQTTYTQLTEYRVVSKLVCISNSVASVSGTVFIPGNTGYTFSSPTQSNFVLYQYVPYNIDFTVLPFNTFIYYYTTNLPIGFQFVLDPSGSKCTLSGISPINNTSQTITVYAKTATSTALSFKLSINTISPFFVNPQLGAGAYTAILRNEVEGNAAQNARDNRTFPQVDALAGPLMAPRAPDVVTALNCFLKLCKKPCPTCKTMM